MSKIVELDTVEIEEVSAGRIKDWLEAVFGTPPVDTGDYHWTGVKG